MKLTFLVLAAGSILISASLLYLLWVARARCGEFERLMGLLHAEYRSGAVRNDYAAFFHSLIPHYLNRRLQQAGWQLRPRYIMAPLFAGFVVVGFATISSGPAGGGMAALALLGLSAGTLQICARRRMRALSEAMPGFLEKVRQAIAVGNSLPGALERAATNSSPVVAAAMAATIRRMHNGSGVAESLERCAGEFDIYDLRLLATAARTNLRFGGSMTQILRNMIENVRRRTAIERELRASTTQIRASAWVLGMLPALVAAMVMLSNRSYARWFWEKEAGHKMLVYALVSQFIGVWLMRIIARTRY
jgi:tight adherence protein B